MSEKAPNWENTCSSSVNRRSHTRIEDEASITSCSRASPRSTWRRTGRISPPASALASAVATSSSSVRRGGAALR
jgi:hypothetical protein